MNPDNVKIKVENLKKDFGHLKVLQGVSTGIYEGEVVVVIGPSGSGKSTFLRCLNQLEEVTEGRIIIDGQDITDPKTDINKLRERVGMVFQHFNLFNNMNVLRNLMLAPVDLKQCGKEEAKARALTMLERVGREYEENIHFAFVETGGGNISHWSFLDGISIENVDAINVPSFSNRSFVICDSDNKSKKERKEKIKRMVGEKCFYELPVREIENTIKRCVLEKTILTSEEDQIIKEYDENKKGYYNQAHIGSFIKEHYKTNKNYEGPRGTILNKMDFARRIVKNIKSTDDLTNVAKDLCGRLVDFIDEANEKLI